MIVLPHGILGTKNTSKVKVSNLQGYVLDLKFSCRQQSFILWINYYKTSQVFNNNSNGIYYEWKLPTQSNTKQGIIPRLAPIPHVANCDSKYSVLAKLYPLIKVLNHY